LLFFISFLYFIPNLYKEVPIVNVYNDKLFSEENKDEILYFLKNNNLKIKDSCITNKTLLIKFFSIEDQLLSKTYLENYFKNNNLNYILLLDSLANIPYWLTFIHSKPMNLGLDLKGGVRFLMEVDVESTIIKNIDNYFINIKNFLKKDEIMYLSSNCLNLSFDFNFNSEESINLAILSIKNTFPELSMDIDYKKKTIRFFLNNSKIDDIKNIVMEQSLYTFRKRIDELGLSESNIRKYGDHNIIIELPGIQNIDRARNILGKTATINFFMLDQNNIYNSLNEYIPIGSKLLYDREKHPILLKKKLILSGEFIVSAYSFINEENKPAVNVKLTNIGAKNFLKNTTDNVGKLMAVVYSESFNEINNECKGFKVKEEVITIAKIVQPLSDNFQVTGLTYEESNDLALLLRAGVLPTNVSIIEEKIIGPSLGKDNIIKGYKAVFFGLILILVFMILYYNIFGIISNICLIFNLILLISCMSILGAVLTLPGIAGIVLTLGMAIDSNVLIFERIRERLLCNDNIKSSIDNGYKYAFITIIDSNLTTFFVGLLLFIIGDGPIKGFAVTLCIGIVTSLYSSIVVTRIIIDIFFKNNIKSLPIGL
jgi:preprotein translocase subunit SecD